VRDALSPAKSSCSESQVLSTGRTPRRHRVPNNGRTALQRALVSMITQLAHQKKTNAAIKLSQRGQNKAAEVLAPLEASASRTPPVEEKRCARSPGPSTTTHMVGAGCTPCPPRGPPQPTPPTETKSRARRARSCCL
jgi:hypothetical protein